MSAEKVIVVGASVGGVEALRQLVAGLPHDFPASVFVVLHLSPHAPSLLPRLLARAGKLPALHPADGERLRRGVIYVAPSDNHMLLEDGRIRVVRGPRENRYRPAIDPLFRSAARAYGPNVIAVVLTGMLDDGAAGMMSVRAHGGIGIVQHPDDAFFSEMPRSAIQVARPQHIVPLADIPSLLSRLVRRRAPSTPAPHGNGRGASMTRTTHKKTKPVRTRLEMAGPGDHPEDGIPSPFACPECNGVLWEVDDNKMLRFRCRVGHAFTAFSLLESQADALEGALWAAIRTLEEDASLSARMADRSQGAVVARFRERAEEKLGHAALLRDLALSATRPQEPRQSPSPARARPAAARNRRKRTA